MYAKYGLDPEEIAFIEAHEFVQVLGLDGRARVFRWIRRDYFTGPESLGKYKVVVPKANGSGVLGEVLSSPLVAGPDVGTTHTFITIGGFDDEATADACLKYVKSKFARAMLGVIKITQDNKRHTWKYVPLQDFTKASDIDWTSPSAGSTSSCMPSTALTPRRSPSSRPRSSRWSDRWANPSPKMTVSDCSDAPPKRPRLGHRPRPGCGQ